MTPKSRLIVGLELILIAKKVNGCKIVFDRDIALLVS